MMAAVATPEPRQYPTPWDVETVRNHAGRKWFQVTRWVSNTRVEYLLNVDGSHRWFRWLQEAVHARNRANEPGNAP